MSQSIHISKDKVNFGYDISQDATEDFSLHCHNFYEIYFFLEGDADYLVEGHKYAPTPNSLLLFAPHVFHGIRINSSRTYRRFSLHFHPDLLTLERRAFLLSVFPSFEKQSGQNIYFENTDAFQIPTYFNAVKDCAFLDEQAQEQMLPLCIEALLGRIVCMCRQMSPSVYSPKADTISRIIWFLNQNLKEDISLDMLSERFFISKHYLNRVFRQATGTTVFDYLLHKRIIAAQQLLINGSSAQNAAEAVGFADYSSFYRSYVRILGHSPLKDRGALPPLTASIPEEQGLAALNLKSEGERIVTNAKYRST